MKNNLHTFLLLMFFLAANSLSAQTNISLKINHKLGGNDFAFETETMNNLNHSFHVDRLEYYMSGFSLIHDGTSTSIPDLHFLVRANEETILDLGSFDVENVSEVRFHIGVDESVNHEDPSTYSSDNPLAPQDPSMHWGWAAGYRFIAMEGKSGAALDQEFQLHGLGDSNYFETREAVTPTTTSDGILIELDADYAKVIKDVNVTNGVVSHGEAGEAKIALENMKNYVFSQAGTTAITDYNAINKLEVFPNPTTNGTIQITVETVNTQATEVQLLRLDGSIISTEKLNNEGIISMQLDAKGFYFLRVLQNGKTVAYQKVVAQ